ncbi:hypothetical protein [Peribacillus frigoritolerans]|uniref:hypothetical protein n=1 Tax=Peribacillus frigoritolerans TaxID=450367 RepID=UPI0039A18248
MANKNPFDETFEPSIEKKNSSYSKGEEKTNFPHEKYQTVRIRPNDFKKLKRYATFKDITMVDAISIAIDSFDLKAAEKEFLEKDE